MSHLSPLLKQSTRVRAIRGSGAYIYDQNDRSYLDFTTGIGVTSTGHCHPKVVAAAQEQAGKLIHGQYATVTHEPLLELTDRLYEQLQPHLDAIAFANAGTEAVETALRLVRHATGRSNIIAFQGGFHGRTVGSASLTSSASKIRTGFHPMMAGVVFAPFPHTYRYGWSMEEATRFCLQELDELMFTQTSPQDTAAMIIEPVQGEYGYYPAGYDFIQGLRERCDEHGILLISDEVQCGYGRTGKFWAGDHFCLKPDILITAKGLASGFPLSGIAASSELMVKGQPGSQGGTYGGNAVACAAALATLEVIQEENLVENAAKCGEHLVAGLEKLVGEFDCLGGFHGVGLMQGLQIVDGDGKPNGELAAKLLKASEDNGLLLLRCGSRGQVVRWLPPLIITPEQIDEALAIFRKAVQASAG